MKPSCHARFSETTLTRIFLTFFDTSPDFDASVVTRFTLPLLQSFSAACAASPGCKPWRALVFIMSKGLRVHGTLLRCRRTHCELRWLDAVRNLAIPQPCR